MSITIHIHRNEKVDGDEGESDEIVDEVSINLPKKTAAKSNNLSNLENSITSSKYSISAEEIISNLSFDSNFFNSGRIFPQSNLQKISEKEIDLEITEEKIHERNSTFSKNYYVNNETNNNFSSERVICEELNNAHEKMNRNRK